MKSILFPALIALGVSFTPAVTGPAATEGIPLNRADRRERDALIRRVETLVRNRRR